MKMVILVAEPGSMSSTTAETTKQWLVFNPSEGDFEGTPDDKVVEFRDYFFAKHAIPLIEEFRQYVALSMLFPDKHNAPSGPVDMVWHSFILNTEEYEDFSKRIWVGAKHMPPEVPEEEYR